MGLLDRFTFWQRGNDDESPEHVDGFEVDSCFTLPDTETDTDTDTDC